MQYVAHMFHCTKMFCTMKAVNVETTETSGDQKIIFLMETHCSTMMLLTTLPLSQTDFPLIIPSLFSSLWLCLQDVRQSGITSDAGWELKLARWWTYPAPKSSSTSPVIKVGLPLYLNREKLLVSSQLITTTNVEVQIHARTPALCCCVVIYHM